MRILVLGGTQFLGRAFVDEALAAGHEVTTFNRGKSGVDRPEVIAIHGDLTSIADLESLARGRSWDAIAHMSGQIPWHVGNAARILSGHAAIYHFQSSIHAFQDWPAKPVDENSPKHECDPAAIEHETYNALKAGCERAVAANFDGKVLVHNPGLITGPHENVGRLVWWLQRAARGGEVLAPGRPERRLQLVDARDIVKFAVAQLEREEQGSFVVSGAPANTTFAGLLAECLAVTGSDANVTWASDEILTEAGVTPWVELPLWAPENEVFDGIWSPNPAKAHAAGFTTRPVAQTVHDTWTWLSSLAEQPIPCQGAIPLGIEQGKEQRILRTTLDSA
jgi:2'-hydroxyisoflavone reductase